MLDTLKRTLETGIFDRVEEYDWNGGVYLRVFVRGRKDCAWDGPKTNQALKLIDEARGASSRLKKWARAATFRRKK